MSWATAAIQKLQEGEQAKIRPRGHSMTGKVNDGERVTLVPAASQTLKIGDIVLVKVKGHIYLHLIKAVNNSRYLIGNNRGGINGWVGGNAIYGLAIDIEP